MKISGVIILSEQGEIIENLEEVNSVVLINDFSGSRICTRSRDVSRGTAGSSPLGTRFCQRTSGSQPLSHVAIRS